MSFFQNYFPGGGSPMKKSHFYVWFLGAKESEGLRGSEYMQPAVRQLIREAERHSPNKLTIQISSKGLKIIQTLPTISKSGKIKMDVLKLLVPAHSLTYSSLAHSPHSDVVGCIMLILNPETRCPIHIHAYRCDSSETASIMNAALQVLINRPENQRRFAEVENRLVLRGLLYPRFPRRMVQRHLNSDGGDDSDDVDRDHRRLSRSIADSQGYASPMYSDMGMDSEDAANTGTSDSGSSGDRVARLHRAVFQELKEKLQNKGPLLLPPKDYSETLRKVGTLTTKKYEERRAKTKQVVGTLNGIFGHQPTVNDKYDGGVVTVQKYSRLSESSKHNDALDFGKYDLNAMRRRDDSQYFNEIRNSATRMYEMPPNCLNPNPFEQSDAFKRRSYAFDCSTDPISASPPPIAKSNGRFRFSISDLPINHMKYLDSSISPYSARIVQQEPPSAKVQLRKFGDTIKPKVDNSFTSSANSAATRSSGAYPTTINNNWTAKPVKYKSLDNLAHANAVNYSQDSSDCSCRKSQQVDSAKSAFQNVWLLPKMVDPFGRKYDQRVKVNNFTDCSVAPNAQPPDSWYIGPCSGYII